MAGKRDFDSLGNLSMNIHTSESSLTIRYMRSAASL